MATADIGLIGLAVMGSNLALNIAEKGYTVAVHNRSAGRIDEFVAEAKAQGLDQNTIPKYDLAEFVQAVKAPRSIIIMVKAGQPVDDMIEQLLPHLSPGDAIIECGNSLYTDTQRRFDYLKPKNIGYLGVGVSGGEEGARHGPSIMVGGSKEQWHNAEAVLTAIAAQFNGESCCAIALQEQQKFLAPLRCRKMLPALFWGTFDVSMLLIQSRMEPFPEDKVIEKAAFDEPMIEYGFWLGDGNVDVPSFFVLPYPFIYKDLNGPSVKPAQAYYDQSLSEYFLDLESAAASNGTGETVQEFFRSTFAVLAQELQWENTSHFFIPLKMKKTEGQG